MNTTKAEAIDPICGMTVDPATARHAKREGKTFYFCGEHCRRRFISKNSSAEKAVDDCCDEEKPVHHDHAARGHEHHKAVVVKLSAAVKYTCPMHPEVVSDKRGNCPKCGMALEPKTVTAGTEENAELRDMTRRLWIGAALTLPVFFLAMSHLIPALWRQPCVTGDA